MKQNDILMFAIIAVVLIATGAGAYYMGNKNPAQEKPVKTASTHSQLPQAPTQQAQAAAPCNDNNIVGTGLGAVAGGVVGSQFGKGSGKTAATIGGVVAGGVAGHELIPTQNVTCR